MSGPIGNINRLVPGLIEQFNPAKTEAKQIQSPDEPGFTELFSNMIDSVNEIQSDSSHLQEAFMNGEPVELHEMMIKAQEAGIAMDLLLEVRNKFINAYNEIMRMQI